MTKVERRAAVAAEVVRRLKEAREARGLSMNALAAQAGLSQSMISRLENLAGNPTLDSLLRIAEVLEIKLGEAIARAEKAVDR